MTEHRTCSTEGHDMRPMNSMGVRVCRRCGFYLPFDEEADDAPEGSMRLVGYALTAATLVALGLFILI